jgi:hypothetical protein
MTELKILLHWKICCAIIKCAKEGIAIMPYQPSGLYMPVLRMIYEQTGDSGIPGFFGYVMGGNGNGNGPGDDGVTTHTHVFSESDFLLTHPEVYIYDPLDEESIIGIDIGASSELQFRFIKDSYDDYIRIDVTFMGATTYKVGIFYQRYDPSTATVDVEDKGNIIKMDILKDGETTVEEPISTGTFYAQYYRDVERTQYGYVGFPSTIFIEHSDEDVNYITITGKFQPLYSEQYNVIVTCENNFKITIGEHVLERPLFADSQTEFVFPIVFVAGDVIDIEVVYDIFIGKSLKVEWQSPSQTRDFIYAY